MPSLVNAIHGTHMPVPKNKENSRALLGGFPIHFRKGRFCKKFTNWLGHQPKRFFHTYLARVTSMMAAHESLQDWSRKMFQETSKKVLGGNLNLFASKNGIPEGLDRWPDDSSSILDSVSLQMDIPIITRTNRATYRRRLHYFAGTVFAEDTVEAEETQSHPDLPVAIC